MKEQQVETSKKLLVTGLFELLKTQPYEKVAISHICDQAGVSRRTFYRYFKKKEDLLEYKYQLLAQDLIIRLFSFHNEKKRLDKFILQYLNFWKKEEEFLVLLLVHNLFPHFSRHFNPIFTEKLKFYRDDFSFFEWFLMGGLTAILIKWIQEDMETTPEILTKQIMNRFDKMR